MIDPDYEWLEPARQFAKLNRTIRRPLVIIPGMTSTALEAWRRPRCSGLDFRALAWGQVSMISEALRDPVCWLETLTLSNLWRDPEYSFLQPVDGFLTDYFVPGYWLWQKVLRNLGSVGYDRSYIEIIGYDWRLDTHFAQQRDDFFGRITAAIDRLRDKHRQKVVIAAHSLGVLWVHHYFGWLEAQRPGFIEEAVDAFVNVGGPLLGVPKTVSSLVSAEMKDTAMLGPVGPRLMDLFVSRRLAVRWFRSFGSLAAMLPCGWDAVWDRVHDFAPVRIERGNATGTAGRAPRGRTATEEGVVSTGRPDHPHASTKRRAKHAPPLVAWDSAALAERSRGGPAVSDGTAPAGSRSFWARCPVTGKSRADATLPPNHPPVHAPSMHRGGPAAPGYDGDDARDAVRVAEHAAAAVAATNVAAGAHADGSRVVPDAFADIHPIGPRALASLAAMQNASRPADVRRMFDHLLPHYTALLDEHWRWTFGPAAGGMARPPVGALAPLPAAPSLRYYCTYGVGLDPETEIGYRYGVNGGGYLSLDTSNGNPVVFGHGDGTVPLASLGYMCAGPWRRRGALNPSGMRVIIREYNASMPTAAEAEERAAAHRRSRWLDRIYTSAAVGGTEGALLSLLDEVEGALMSIYGSALHIFAKALSLLPRLPEKVVDVVRGASTTSSGHVEILGHRQFIIDLLLIASEPSTGAPPGEAEGTGLRVGGAARQTAPPEEQTVAEMIVAESDAANGSHPRALPAEVGGVGNVEGDAAKGSSGGSGGVGSLGGGDTATGVDGRGRDGAVEGDGDGDSAAAAEQADNDPEHDVMQDMVLSNVMELSAEIMATIASEDVVA